MFAYYNGYFGKFSDVKIPLSDRSIFFGDGVYDAAIGRQGKIFMEDEHIERFLDNAGRIGLKLNHTKATLSALLGEIIQKSGIEEYFLYFQCTGFLEERLHAPRDKRSSNILVTVKPYRAPDRKNELRLVSYPDLRQSFCNVKSLNLLGSALASEYAVSEGGDEAVFVKGSYVTECARSNVFIISGGRLLTHPCDEKILPGISRKTLLSIARKRGVITEERPFSLSELFSADDVIVTSTSKLALRAKTLDGVEISRKKGAIGDALIDDMFKCYGDFCRI